MNSFVTIVSHIDNTELRKDTGQIPYHISKFHFDTKLVTYYYKQPGRINGPEKSLKNVETDIRTDYPYLFSEVIGLNLHFLPFVGRKKFYEKAIFDFIKSNAKKIDVLNLYHFSSETIFYTLLYKFFHRKGKVYIKLDIDILHYEMRKSFFNVTGRFGAAKKILYKNFLEPYFFRNVDLFSAESNEGIAYFTNRFPLSKKKTILIQNGIDRDRIIKLNGHLKQFEEKENEIIAVGEVGDKNKNHIFLLNALKNVDLKGWRITFVGKLNDDFEDIIGTFLSDNPQLKNSVTFTGHIEDPKKLYSIYNRAKIFCMPSLGEGFPLSSVEAAYFGNVLLLSENIAAFDTLTNYGKGGDKFSVKDVAQLSFLLNLYINNPLLLKEKHLISKKHAENEFVWQNIVLRISKALYP